MFVIRLSIFCRIACLSITCLIYSFAVTPIFFSLPCLAAPLTPDKNVTVVTTDRHVPEWKRLWDEARELSQMQKTDEAIARYLEVLEIKPHIEEVKWELSRNYVTVKQFDKALMILERLLEASPEKIEYLVSAGQAALQQQKVSLAGRYFGQALALDPGGSLSGLALMGLVEALYEQDKKNLAIPLMEQLFQRGILGQDSLLELARYYTGQSVYSKGAFYYKELIGTYQVDDQTIREAAHAFEQSRQLDAAAGLWESYLKTHPDYNMFRIKLADYFTNQKRLPDALPHLIYLTERNIDRQNYLLQIAEIYLYELGRSDRALHYFEQYRQEFPDGVDVSKEISGLQIILANDFLSIVENDGVWMLWRDLADVTPSRIGIYRAMADMLQDMGRGKETQLIEILKIINTHQPEDVEIISKLARIYRKTGRISECRAFLKRAEAANKKTAAIHLLKAQCESADNDDLGRLKSYVRYLELKPDDQSIRLLALELAGSLGLVEQLKEIYRNAGSEKSHQLSEIDYVYARQLLKNGLARNAESFLEPFVDSKIDSGKSMKLEGESAALDLRQNRPYKAEQNLRVYSARNHESIDGYLLLAGFFIDKENVESAGLWHDVLENSHKTLNPAQKSMLFYQKLLIDRAEKKVDVYQQAVRYLNFQLKTNRIVAEDVDILLFAAEHYLLTNRYRECVTLINRFRPKFKGVDSVSALLAIAKRERDEKQTQPQSILDDVSLSVAIAVAEQFSEFGRYEDARTVLTDVAGKLPESTRVKVLLADAQVTLLTYQESAQLFEGLAEAYETETYFKEQIFSIEELAGAPKSIFKEFNVSVDDSGRKNTIHSAHAALDYPELKLRWARALWSDDNWEESLDVYGLLDTEMKRKLDPLKQNLDELQDYQLAPLRIDFSERKLTFDNPDVIDVIMSEKFVSENLGGDIVQKSSQFYDSYRWAKIINKEMTAKSSLKAKEFYQAEIDYRSLFQEEEDVTEPVYTDLATVYDRLGRHQEEAELLEKIKETRGNYPEFSQISEKTIRRQQPHLFVEGGYLEEEGRDGFKNLTRYNVDLGFKMKPTLYQEIGFVAGHNEYGTSDISTLAKSTSLLGTYSFQVTDDIEGIGEIGMEDFEGEGETYLLYDFMLKGTVEELVELYGGIKQEPVYDTVDALLSDVYRRDIKFGFSLDYLFGMFFGFDLDFINYSDDNTGEQYYLWSSYRWFGDRSSVDLTYSYLNLQNEISNEMFTDEDRQDAPPYWSPGDYWKHGLSGTYKVELWPTGRLQSGTGSFSARYGIGYEKGDSFIQEIEMNILLEITTSFLVKGTFSTILSDDYDKLNGSVSVGYRW